MCGRGNFYALSTMPIRLLSEAECEGDGIMVGDIGHSVITVEHLECARAHAFVEDVVDYLLIVRFRALRQLKLPTLPTIAQVV